jgi:hypothetical protein
LLIFAPTNNNTKARAKKRLPTLDRYSYSLFTYKVSTFSLFAKEQTIFYTRILADGVIVEKKRLKRVYGSKEDYKRCAPQDESEHQRDG